MSEQADEDTEVGFGGFVAARGPALWRSAWLLTGDAQRAEDLVQTALSRVWPHWPKVTRSGSPEAYVRRVLYTTYAAWWRRRWNSEVPSGASPQKAAVVDATASIDARQDLVAALAELPRGQRAVVVLRYFEDLTTVETAAVLGCSEGAVKSQTHRALATLRSSRHLQSRNTEHG